jgi:hypothetical protein
MMAIAYNSMKYRLMMEGKLSNNVRRAAFDQLERVWEQRVAPSLWAMDQTKRRDVGLLDEEQERRRARERDVDLTKAKHDWLVQSLAVLEANDETAQAFAAEGARRGDNELPTHMQKPVEPTEMARLYANMEESAYRDGEIEPPPPFSRLTLLNEPAPERPRPGHPTPAAPPRATTPTRPRAPSDAEMARRTLPQQFHVDDASARTIPSKTVRLREPRS